MKEPRQDPREALGRCSNNTRPIRIGSSGRPPAPPPGHRFNVEGPGPGGNSGGLWTPDGGFVRTGCRPPAGQPESGAAAPSKLWSLGMIDRSKKRH